MTQQENHNTAAGDDMSPFDWQLDQIHWRPAPVRQQLSAEAAPFRPGQQPGGEYIPPFNLPSPLEPLWDPMGMFPGHYGPPPPMPFFVPFHPMFFPPPPMFEEPGWFPGGLSPYPYAGVRSAPHTPSWNIPCGGPFSPLPGESPFMVGASGPPPRPRNWSAPPSYGPQDPESDTWVTIPSARTPTSSVFGEPCYDTSGPQDPECDTWVTIPSARTPASSVFGEPYHDACEVIGRRPAPVEQTRQPDYNLRIANVAIWLTAQEGETEEPESDIWGEISCPDGPDEQSEEAESDTSSVVFFLNAPPPRALEELERARRSSPRG